MGAPDGRCDGHCERHSDSADWYPPLPAFGGYAAETCLPADVEITRGRSTERLAGVGSSIGSTVDRLGGVRGGRDREAR